jgi:type I restriction enzyme S subunit
MLKLGDILLSKDGTIGKIGYVDSLELPTSVASGIFVIRNTKPDIISTTFIYYLLKSRLFTSFIAARTEGSVIPHLYQKDFMEFEFPLPTAERMAAFEDVAEPMFSQIVNNLNENKKLAILRDGLLPRLMSGELDVSDIDL